MEPFVHALIPLAFLLALFPNLDKKYIFYLVPIVWIIDLDTFIGIHRFTFHNLSFVLLLAVIVYFLWDKRAFWIALFYGFSHLLLDFAWPGPAWFYPFIDKSYYLTASIHRGTEWIVNLSLGSLMLEEYQALAQGLGPPRYVGETSVLFLLLFGIVLLVKFRKEIAATLKIR